MSKHLLHGKLVIKNRLKEIGQNQLKCASLIKARFRTMFILTVMMSLMESNRTVITVCFYFKNLKYHHVKKLELEQRWTAFVRIIVYLVVHIPAGRLSELYGAKWFIFTAVVGSGLCLAFIPLVLDTLRSALGMEAVYFVNWFFSGLTLPSGTAMLARWAIPSERFLMTSIVYSSYPLGKTIGLVLAICLCCCFGWQVTLYVASCLCAFMAVMWGLFIHDDYESPRERITKQEKEFMKREMAGHLYQYQNRKFSRVPLKEIIKCQPLWAVLVAHLTLSFCTAKLLTPILKNLVTLEVGVDESHKKGPMNYAVIIAQPFFMSALLTWILGMAFFNLVSAQIITKRGAYQAGSVMSLLGFFVMLIIKLVRPDEKEDQISLLYDLIGMSTVAPFSSTAYASYLDMAPNYAGTLLAIHNVIITVPELLIFTTYTYIPAVYYVGYAAIAALVMMTLFFYLFFVTGDLMAWNNYPLAEGHTVNT